MQRDFLAPWGNQTKFKEERLELSLEGQVRVFPVWRQRRRELQLEVKVGKIGMERCGEATVAEIVQAALGDCKVSHATWTLSSG